MMRLQERNDQFAVKVAVIWLIILALYTFKKSTLFENFKQTVILVLHSIFTSAHAS